MEIRFYDKKTGKEMKTIPGNILVLTKHGTILEYGKLEHSGIVSHNAMSLRNDVGVELISGKDTKEVNHESKNSSGR